MNISLQQVREALQPFEGWKGKLPFRLGTTSYIYPGEIIQNVEVLGDFFDEIQLLLFEGNSCSNIPDSGGIQALKMLACEKKLAYTVHLPLDAYPGHQDETIRHESVEMIRTIYNAGTRLGCDRFVFHYANRNPEGKPVQNRCEWRNQLVRSTEELLSSGIQANHLCVENLTYPFYWVEDLVHRYALSKCIDMGHLRVNCYPIRPHLKKHLRDTRVIHLHGVRKGRDHLGLSNKDARAILWLFEEMKQVNYRETLILEVFQLDYLVESLQTFKTEWEKWQMSY
jgi:sugar phosphate isomerase/epimerase